MVVNRATSAPAQYNASSTWIHGCFTETQWWIGPHPSESRRFTRTGADIGYSADGDEGGRAGAKSNECKKDKSDEAIEEMSVSVNREVAWFVKIEGGGASRLSDGREELVSSSRSSNPGDSLFRSAD